MKVYVIMRVFDPWIGDIDLLDIAEIIGVYTTETKAREAQEKAWDYAGEYSVMDVVFEEVIIDED